MACSSVSFSGAGEAYAVAVFLLFFAAATVYDLRERRIPNAVNFGALLAGIALAVYFKPGFLAGYFLFVAISFAFAYALYKLGAWAGGDVKFFLALGALYPVAKGTGLANAFDFLAIFAVFVFAAIATVPVLVPLALKKAPQLMKALKENGRNAFSNALDAAPLSAALVGILNFVLKINPIAFLAVAALAFFVRMPFYAGLALFFVMLFFDASTVLVALPFSFAVVAFIGFCIKSFPALSSKVLRRKVKTMELKEGDIPAYSIYLDSCGKPCVWKPSFSRTLEKALEGNIEFAPKGKVVANSLAARGLTAAEIRKLKALGIKALEVKEAMPFAPALGIGWLLAVALW